jgi:hypothetical protein
VEHRHLLPDEIDIVVDGEAGFGVAPLVAHVEHCARCRSEVEAMRSVVRSLEDIPHFAASPRFAERVMAQVQVFEPWYVTAADNAKRWLPQSTPARVAAAAMLAVTGLVLSISAVWLAVRADAMLFFFNVAAARVRSTVLAVVGNAVADLFGQSGVDALRASGSVGAVIALTGFLVALVIAALGLRALAGVSRRRRI